MASVMANHATILKNQDFISTQLSHQHDCIERMKAAVAANTEVTEEVRALLSTFKVVSSFTRWGAVVSAAAFSTWHGIKAAFQFWK